MARYIYASLIIGTDMIVLGVLLKGSQARFVAVSGGQLEHSIVETKTNKLELPKDPTQDDVQMFVQAFTSFCAVNSVDMVVVNRRQTAGQGAGGHATFITEGVLLATCPRPMKFMHPATIRATDRKKAGMKKARPSTADLGQAYDLAFEGLPA